MLAVGQLHVFIRVTVIAEDTEMQHLASLRKYTLPSLPLFQVDLRASDWQRGITIFLPLLFLTSGKWYGHVKDTSLFIACDIRF